MRGLIPWISVVSSQMDSNRKAVADYYCDGTDDDVQIQLALDDAADQGGGVVLLSPGSFIIGNSLKIGDNTSLRGSGPATIVILATDAGDIPVVTNSASYTSGVRHGTGNHDISVFHITLDGDKDNRGVTSTPDGSLQFNTVSNLLIWDVHVVNGWVAGIHCEFCDYVHISENTVYNSGAENIAIDNDCTFVTVSRNKLSFAGLGKAGATCHGIEVKDGSHDIVVHANLIVEPLTGGVQIAAHASVSNPFNVTVSCNQIFDTPVGVALHGVSGYPISDCLILGNTINMPTDANHYPFRFYYTENCTIQSNICSAVRWAAYGTTSNLRLSFLNNRFLCSSAAANTNQGFKLDGTYEDLMIQGNLIRNFGYCGIKLSNTQTNVHIIDNMIIDVTNASGRCVHWNSPTSSRCRINNNYLRGKHWSRDEATATYDVLSANWTETYNEKHLT